MINKKSLSSIITVLLLLSVLIISVSIYETWFNDYNSKLISNIKDDNTKDIIRVEDLVNNKLFIYSSKNQTLNNLKIISNNITKCTLNMNLTKGITQISTSGCNLNKGESYNILGSTDSQIIESTIINK